VCANCHNLILQGNHTSGMAGLRHPAGNPVEARRRHRNELQRLRHSGVMTNVTAGFAFSTLVPFEIGSADYNVLKPYAVTSVARDDQAMPAASTMNNVACVSCHRAHASGFASSMRFLYRNDLMTVADSANVAIYDSSTTENQINFGYTQAQQQNAYHGRPARLRPVRANQCNKCHAKD